MKRTQINRGRVNTPPCGRSHTIHVDVYKGERFVCTNHLKVKMTYSFRFGRWVVAPEDIGKALMEKYPSMSNKKEYEFFIS